MKEITHTITVKITETQRLDDDNYNKVLNEPAEVTKNSWKNFIKGALYVDDVQIVNYKKFPNDEPNTDAGSDE